MKALGVATSTVGNIPNTLIMALYGTLECQGASSTVIGILRVNLAQRPCKERQDRGRTVFARPEQFNPPKILRSS
jgi:hypothetical protein